ncbi:MAG: Enoyl-CoA hydratase/isomerase family protein [Rhodobacteraceae bacterium]|uniref:enoyl-CoA hydratase/isomerase family protein n=1 Tax=Cypionkella sp. TaxID=2811411 RepID=UPI0013298494|nr:enoyl-CoA hydratase/isomerase family protein [Cypionkella sp.]KAF0175008.1 MAG: Enoyl-CoA hydratase/isomerase family protein [Paracoccaceae bacterium]MDO8325500.1 enoyl-CoA hydratase/isomerase family protein [Cypionkella sp.]
MIEIERDAGLLVLRLNRSDKANSLTKAMLEALDAALSGDTPAALILTGAGKVFSAGADLDEARAGLATDGVWERLSGRIAALPCLTIAALNGTLAGGAMGMVLACDLRLAVPPAKFFYPVMKLGFLPQPSDPARLVALIGPARAKLILMGGAKIEADEALAWGLIDRIVEPQSLLETARALAADTLAAKPGHAAAIKRLIG